MTKSLIPLVGLGLALGACAGVNVVDPPYISSSYDQSYLNTVAKYGEVPLEVRNNPFNVSKNELDAAVASAVDRNGFGPKLNFTTTPAADLRSPYKLIVFFDPAPGAQAHKICYDGDQPVANDRTGVRALVVFCTSGDRVSSTVASNQTVTSLDDPRFRKLLQQSLAEILPPRRVDINGREFNSSSGS